jgi:hypothetical protein
MTRPHHAAGYSVCGEKHRLSWVVALIVLLFVLGLIYVAGANARSAAEDAAWRVGHGN